jgi:hypothetical protein
MKRNLDSGKNDEQAYSGQPEDWGNPQPAGDWVHRGIYGNQGESPGEQIGQGTHGTTAEEPDVDAAGIEVRVDGGEVTLTGTVRDDHARRLAEDIAASTPRVRGTRNGLHVGERAISDR